MKKALITGVTGQDGAYLANLLLSKGYKVFGATQRSIYDNNHRLRRLGIDKKIYLINLDLTNRTQVIQIVRDGQYDEIYNLAAQSSVSASWETPIETSFVNAIGPLHILEAIATFSPSSKFFQASTSAILAEALTPLGTTKLYSASPYGTAKQFAHTMTGIYRERYRIHACCGILYNHESPLRGSQFVTKKISEQVANYKVNKICHLTLGNINLRRDWGYAPEYVHGMWLMLQHDQPDDFVLATGKTQTIKEFLEDAFRHIGVCVTWQGTGHAQTGHDKLTNKIIVRIDPEFYRPTELIAPVGDPNRTFQKLGWKAKTYAPELAKLMVEADIAEMKGVNQIK